MSGGPETYSLNPSMTVFGHIFHSPDAIKTPSNLESSFFPLYIHYADFVAQGNLRAAHISGLHPELLAQLTSMLHQNYHYVQTFLRSTEIGHTVRSP